MINISSRPINNNESAQTKISAAETARKNNYLFFGEVESSTPLDDLDSQIKEYFSFEKDKFLELTNEEKQIYGNRELKQNYQKMKLIGK